MTDPVYLSIIKNTPVSSAAKGESDFIYEEMLKILRSAYGDSYSQTEIDFVYSAIDGDISLTSQQGSIGKLRSPYKDNDHSLYALTSAYGPRNLGTPAWHNGVDLGSYRSKTVVSVAAGTVISVGQSFGVVTVEHPVLPSTGSKGYTVYMHMWPLYVKKGDVVSIGQPLGEQSGRGNGNNKAYVSHLHFEVRGPNKFPLDPALELDLTKDNKNKDLKFKKDWSYLFKEYPNLAPTSIIY